MKKKNAALIAIPFVAFLLGGLAAWLIPRDKQAMPIYTISQKGRQFYPSEIAINKNQSIEIINDDGDLRHHAYISSENMTFDSGDQEPGSRTDISFPTLGTFDVLCAIHPKMKLVVTVR